MEICDVLNESSVFLQPHQSKKIIFGAFFVLICSRFVFVVYTGQTQLTKVSDKWRFEYLTVKSVDFYPIQSEI